MNMTKKTVAEFKSYEDFIYAHTLKDADLGLIKINGKKIITNEFFSYFVHKV